MVDRPTYFTASSARRLSAEEGTPYDHDFFKAISKGSERSARIVVPLVVKLLRPTSVVDVGCGIGTWLEVFFECGVNEILGLDGEYVQRKQLRIDPTCFQAMDLRRPTPLPRTFDLAISLEVAEHLPRNTAPLFVKFLTSLAPVVLFSAAIPGQGGTSHINEQWPWFWEKLFVDRHFLRLDLFRPVIWQYHQIDWWYRQNIVLFVHEASLKHFPELLREYEGYAAPEGPRFQLIREDILQALTICSPTQLLCQLPMACWDAIRRRFGKR